ncbi:substrate-binding domain-containing protein [Microbacterium profundi]|uniref:LacI family DNA-binding transcriptional regulator n=1 Tax=Microbacterium profundi TaxID=450380 RepID=UPI001F1BA41A|nr:substrate-binding domain-containing protein [Microbacterium profundi]MCE7481517.1 substrate-binding domain-containing protein [Microbacterium profundi]
MAHSTDRLGKGWDGRAVGLVLRRPVRTLGIEAFYNDFMAGVEDALNRQDQPFLLQVVPDMESELDAYHRWHESGKVGAVLLVDVLVDDDPRLSLVDELGFAVLVLANPQDAGGHSVLWTDEAAVVQSAVDHLVQLGHTRLGRVSGPVGFSHTTHRTTAFVTAAAAAGANTAIAAADFSREGGAAAVRQLLRSDAPPTGIMFDNDVMAAGAVEAIVAMGLRVPEDVSILACDDSVLCRITKPPLTAVSRDVHTLGEKAGEAIMRILDGADPALIAAPTPQLIARESTGPVHPYRAGDA